MTFFVHILPLRNIKNLNISNFLRNIMANAFGYGNDENVPIEVAKIRLDYAQRWLDAHNNDDYLYQAMQQINLDVEIAKAQMEVIKPYKTGNVHLFLLSLINFRLYLHTVNVK